MSLPTISGEFGVVQAPELAISATGPWAKIRGVAKDRKKGANGEWEDGPPCYMDIVVGGKLAENVMESVTIGDAIVVSGTLSQREWLGSDGKTQHAYSIRASSVGVSAKYTPVPTARFRGESKSLASSSHVMPSAPEEEPF